MKSLKELVYMQALTGESDLDIIQRWFIENDMEQEGLKIIAELSYSKSNKIQQTLDYARMWLPYACAMPKQPRYAKKRHYYDKKTETNLINITQYHLLKMSLPEFLLDWAKENIPQMERPFAYFQPTIDWLKEKYGIEFKEIKNESSNDKY